MFKITLTISFLSICLQLGLANLFEQLCLNRHNHYRDLHSVPSLEIDDTVQAFAQEHADHLASSNSIPKNPNNTYGQNIYGFFGGTLINGEEPVNAWYEEIKIYDWNHPGYKRLTGSFTQVVWKSTRKLGCAMAKNGTNIYVVANYSPPGNIAGKFKENVTKVNLKTN